MTAKDRLVSKLVSASALVSAMALTSAGIAMWLGMHTKILPTFIAASCSAGLFGIGAGLAMASVGVDRLPNSIPLSVDPITSDPAPTLIYRQVQPATRTSHYGRN